MPTVKIIGPYRFHFYSSDHGEPAHVHVQRDEANAKFWLDSVRLDRSQRFPAQNLQASRNWWSVTKRNSGEMA
jgi:hypothetical protein